MAKSLDKTPSGRRKSTAQSTSFVTPKSGRSERVKVLSGKSGRTDIVKVLSGKRKEIVGSFVEVVDVRPGGRLVVRETEHQGQKVKVYRLKGGAIRKSGRRMAIIAETPESQKLSLQHINQEANEIVARVVDWAGGEDEAWKWYRAHPIPAFGDRTAESLVKTGNAEQVREYLDAVATGAFS